MKKIVLVLLVALMGTTMMTAQPPRGAGMVRDRVAHLEKELNLTKEQKAQITQILKDGMSQMEVDRPQLKEGEKPDQADMASFRERFMKQQAEMNAQIEKVLTPEQLTKFQQLKKEEQSNEGPRGGRGPKDRHHGKRPHGDHHKMAPKDGKCCKDGEKKDCCDQPKSDEKPANGEGE